MTHVDHSPDLGMEGSRPLLAALQKVLGAVLAMRRGDDLEGLLQLLLSELRELAVDVDYCGVNLIDETEGTFQFYGANPAGIQKSRRVRLEEFRRGAPPGFEAPPPGKVVIHGRPSHEVARWMEHLNACGGEVTRFDPSMLPPEIQMVGIGFEHGVLIIGRSRGPAFSSEETEVFSRFAELLSLGYTRFLDFRRLERQNQALRLTAAVDRVQLEVGRMERSHDWGRVVQVLVEELTSLGVSFQGCSINIIDEASGLFRMNIVLPRVMQEVIKEGGAAQLVAEMDDGRDLWSVEHPLQLGKVPSPDAYAAWREGQILIRRLSEEEREQRFSRSFQIIGFNADTRAGFPRATLDVPFSQGLIALTDASEQAFDEKEVAIVREFARVIETGYRRWLDIRELEDKNHMLETVNHELRETQAQLVQSAKMAAMGELVAGVAHEINTPLGAIKSTADVVDRLLARMGSGDDEGAAVSQARELLGISQSAVTRIVDIVRDLRNFARLDEAELQDADLHAGIESTLNLMRHETGDRIEIVRRFSELPRVRCYPNRMNQVFMNLLKNAVDAIEDRGTVTISTRLDGERVRLSFADTGQGIPPEHLERVFDPGFTTRGVGVGTGLGLSICARIMEAHGGHISVESAVGKGTTFHLELPLRAAVSAAEVGAGIRVRGRIARGPAVRPVGAGDGR